MEKETFNEKLLRKELKDLQGAYDIALNEMNMKDKEIEANNKYIRNLTFSSNQISMDNQNLLKRIAELQAEIEHEKETSCLAIMKVEDDKKKLKEMQKSLLCSIGNIRGNLANYQINHNEQQLNDIYEICNENLN